MRVKVRLGRDSVIALNEVKSILFENVNTRVTNGYIIGKAWNKIVSNKDRIDWYKVGTEKISSIADNKDSSIVGVQTTLNLEESILDSIKEFQYSLSQEYKEIYYFPYVVKLILFAVILEQNGKLPLKQ